MRTKVMAMLVAAAVGALTPAAHATATRTASVDYVAFNGVWTPAYGTGFTIAVVRPQLVIPVTDGETSATFRAIDLSGGDVHVQVAQDMTIVAQFCGETDGPVDIIPGEDLRFYVLAGTCEDGSPSVPTGGRIFAELAS